MCGPMPRMHVNDGTGKALCKQPRMDFVYTSAQFWAFAANKAEDQANGHKRPPGVYVGFGAYRCKACEKKLAAKAVATA